jgi:spermidine synthase
MKEIDRRVEGNLLYELSEEGGVYQVRADGRPLFSTVQRGERSLAELAIAPWEGRNDVTVLVGGLGAGFTLRAILDRPEVARVDVVEVSSTVVDWHRKYFAAGSGHPADDPRVVVHNAELGEFLRSAKRERWFVVLLDLDEWPEALSRPENVEHYHAEGLELYSQSMRGDGVLLIWTTRRDDELEARMQARFGGVARVAIPVDVGDTSRLDYVYRARRK